MTLIKTELVKITEIVRYNYTLLLYSEHNSDKVDVCSVRLSPAYRWILLLLLDF
jgi:hypothetical protein